MSHKLITKENLSLAISGIFRMIKKLEAHMESIWNTKLSDAPSDGKQYARQEGEWTEVDSIYQFGKFLTGWNAVTGQPTTQPPELPYAYTTGDYFVVEVVAEDGGTNYKPNGTSYDGTASTTVETEPVNIGDFYFFDNTVWLRLQNTANVNDVQVNGTTILNNGVANITKDANPTNGSNNFVSSGGVYTQLAKRPEALQSTVTYYVSANGSDTTGDGTQSKPFETITKVLSKLPKNLGNRTAKIIMLTDMVLSQTNIDGFYNGVIRIEGNKITTTNTSQSALKVTRTQELQLYISKIVCDGNFSSWYYGSCVNASSSNVYFYTKCEFSRTGYTDTTGCGICATNGSNIIFPWLENADNTYDGFFDALYCSNSILFTTQPQKHIINSTCKYGINCDSSVVFVNTTNNAITKRSIKGGIVTENGSAYYR